MKLSVDYLEYLDEQCEEIIKVFSDRSYINTGIKQFGLIFQNLEKDFLPPVDREDIASLSLMLNNIFISAKEYCGKNVNVQKDELYSQLNLIKQVTKEFMRKGKTCGEGIRRLTEKNIICKIKIEESNDFKKEYATNVNESIADFTKCIVSAYFKNL